MAPTGFAELASGLASAAKLVKSLKDLVTAPEAKAHIVELYDVILSTQADALEGLARERSLIEELSELKGSLARMQDWEKEKVRYRLAVPSTGAIVYALLRSASNGEVPHYICANCYQQGKRSILNNNPGSKDRWYYWSCPNCRSESHSGLAGPSPMQYAEDIPARK